MLHALCELPAHQYITKIGAGSGSLSTKKMNNPITKYPIRK